MKDANGLVTKYEYDAKDNLISKTEEYCGCASVTPGKTYYSYDAFGNMTNLVLSTGAAIALDYDARGNLLTMKDGKGNLIQAYTYYDNGLVKTETDTSGTSTYFYDARGNLTKSVDADGQATLMSYDFNGKLTRMVEDNGTPNDRSDDEVSTFSYDKLGRETLADYGDGIWVKYDYQGAGGDWAKLEAPTIGKMERKLTADGKLAGWVTPDGGTPTFIYDAAGRLWKETDATGRPTTEYTYDAVGRVIQVKDLTTGAIASKHYDAGGRVTEEISPLLGFVKYEYYGAREGGKLKSTTRGQYQRVGEQLVVDPAIALQTTSYEYNGLRTTVIDPLGRRTTSVMDEYSLPIATLFENRNGKTYQSSQSYLYANNLQEAKDYPTRIVDIGGNDRIYTYDESGRLKTATDLGDGIYTYAYGDEGLESITSPEGETLRYGYDELRNLSRITYGDGTFRTLAYDETTNQLKTITLASSESITYTADRAARTQTQTTSTGLSTVSTFTAQGAIQTVTDHTGTTTYHYDPQTQQLAGIDMPSGASVRYAYDQVGRVTTLVEKTSATGIEYKTDYGYDSFGNLAWVKDPANGMTTMTYDTLNRLTQRLLPNGMTTQWLYDALDRIQSVVHKDAQGSVVSSVSYERSAGGEPIKITREDGSYTQLQYDAALRVTKEQVYNAQNALVDERTYVYDDDGKRIATISALGTSAYEYTAGYQLDSITSTTGTEDYDYDVNGRMELMQRDGQTLDLDHDVFDRLTAVKNLTSGTTTNYVYDGEGRRVKATSAGNERYFLVTPAMGNGLESTDLMFDQGGNITANYVYAGGYSPFMKLDANGNPVYYLTDGMGSVIGMANQAGQSVAKFGYDSFGNIRTQSGSLADSTGGDFRFQGQWLESATGIYHFRARDYDSKTGTFLSRDPISPTQQQPEAMNPYQAMYNNPYVYSDPTGMFTLADLNISQRVQDILNGIQTQLSQQVRQYLTDQAKGLVGNVIQSMINTLLPADSVFLSVDILQRLEKGKNGGDDGAAGKEFEDLLQDKVCSIIAGSYQQYIQNLWLEPRVATTGKPESDGFNCGDQRTPSREDYARLPGRAKTPRPDFIFKEGGPRSTDYTRSSRWKKAYLIGDIKITGQAMVDKINSTQWQAIMGYATTPNNHQYVPIAMYVTFTAPTVGQRRKVEAEAARHGVLTPIISIIPRFGKNGRELPY